MRTKANVRFLAKVVDLTQQDQLLPTVIVEPSTVTQITERINSTNAKHAKDVMTNAAGKVHKVYTKKHQSSAGKTPSLKRTKRTVTGRPDGDPIQPPPLAPIAPPGGLYRMDLTQLITQKLRAMQAIQRMSWLNRQQNTMMAHSSSNVLGGPWMAHVGDAGGAMPNCCSVPGCQQAAVSIPASVRTELRTPVTQQPAAGRQFSIFHSVELLAQSSCRSNYH
ncbi:AGAP007959-PA [Anopheles gambiae str. PEST]|uniref:AGAP007959-PA n=1 Tax=Anopheles gambiae TaxID=7165 RepID=Q7Q3N2_ANOGA|nr:AGAP007959-PA [Anopheles gambiae str. PEST]